MMKAGCGKIAVAPTYIHIDHLTQLMQCFNPFTDKVYVYKSGPPECYGDYDTKNPQVELIDANEHGWYDPLSHWKNKRPTT